MKKSNISWEIVLAGVAFIAIGIYLLNKEVPTQKSSSATIWHSEPQAPTPPSKPSLPGAIVIDLNNLEDLKNLENLHELKNLEDFKDLEIEIRNLDKIIGQNDKVVQESLDKNLKELETELQKIENADFKVKLQNQKLYINKNYNVAEAKWTEVKSGVYVFQESFSNPNLQSMNLEVGFGNLNIVGSNGNQSEITLRATGNVEDPAIFSRELSIQKNLEDSEAEFRVTSADNSDISDQINLEATLTIPKSIKLRAQTAGGHVNASNMTNNQRLETAGGHISLHNIAGETIAKTGGGHITVDHISGNASLSTGGGHIKVQRSSGSLTTKTGGGHIEVQSASGSISAKTSGGNISAAVTQAEGPLKFYTSAGNVSLEIPREITADLDVSGSSVSLDDAFNFDGKKTQENITGTINGGGIPVVINCGFGNVNISSN